MATITYTINGVTDQIAAPSGVAVPIPGSEGQDVAFTVTSDAQTALYVAPPDEGGSAPLVPIDGIVNASQVILVGASILEEFAGNRLDAAPGIVAQQLFDDLGFSGTLRTYCQAGDAVSDTITRVNQALADFATEAANGELCFLIHTGGNNVSSNRPYEVGEAGAENLANDLETLSDNIAAGGNVHIPANITFRHYNNTVDPTYDDGLPDRRDNDTDGSWPYNREVVHPYIQTRHPVWFDDTAGAPVLNMYDYIRENPDFLSSDGVHGAGSAIGQRMMLQAAARARGVEFHRSRAGKSVLLGLHRTSQIQYLRGIGETGAVNQLQTWANAGLDVYSGAKFIGQDPSEDFDYSLEVLYGSVAQGGISGVSGTSAFARLSDTRFHDATLTSTGIYVTSQTPSVTFRGLYPGDTCTLSAMACRSAGGSNRRGDLALDISGEVQTLDAANDAASNQVVFSPFVVPPSGEVTLTLSLTPGASYGYLSGILLDFS